MFRTHRLRHCLTAVLVTLTLAASAAAQNVTAPGYIHSFATLSDTTQSCVAIAPGGTFVGRGPGFSANAQSVVFVSSSGTERTVVSGFNSISDCAYDAGNDVLYITDNAGELPGAVTGDTVFYIPSASTATSLTAAGHELAAEGAIPNAASVAISAVDDVYVSESAGGGSGDVRKLAGGSLSTFIANQFDFTAGLAFEPGGSLLVAETLDSFAAQVSRYDADGDFVELVSGPTFDHGSYDLAHAIDGRVLVTGAFGGDVVSLDASDGDLAAFASGFSFATSIDVDAFSGRVDLVSSTFVPLDEDFRLHRLIPIGRLVPDGGSATAGGRAERECVAEWYGVEPALKSNGKPSTSAVCTDGAACDDDRSENGSCTFALGLCFNVDDDRLPACTSNATSSFELKAAKPASAEVTALAGDIAAAMPIAGTQCFLSDGVAVALKTTNSGKIKPGKAVVKVLTKSVDPTKKTDPDVIKLVCSPAP